MRSHPCRFLRAARGAFTLAELLIVVTVLAILMAILAPSVLRAGNLARQRACAANIREIVRGVIAYTQDAPWHRGSSTGAALPTAGNLTTGNWQDLKSGNLAGLWLLISGRYPNESGTPYVKKQWVGEKVFVCPEAGAGGLVRAPSINDRQFLADTTSYGYLSQVPFADSVTSKNYSCTPISQAGSSLVVVADQNPHCRPGSGTPWDVTMDNKNSSNHSSEGQNVGLLDGSAKWISTTKIDNDDIYRYGDGTDQSLDSQGRRSTLDDYFIIP